MNTSCLPALPCGQGIREINDSRHFHKEIIFSFGWQSTNTSGVDNNYKIQVLQNVTALIILHLQLHSHWPICQDFLFATDKRRNKFFSFPLLLHKVSIEYILNN